MSDVEVIDRAEIVRREVDRESTERALAVIDPAVLDTLFASREPAAIVQRIADVSTVLMDAVHQRDLARKYGDNDNEFLHIEAWQFLGSMLGMTAISLGAKALADGSGYEAVAELRHVASGRVLGAADAMCQKTERGREKNPPNTLRQMAQIRARRAAARSVLGFVPRIGGFEIADPDAPATKEQVGLLHQLERELGWSHEEGHAQAGEVESFKDLNREEASVLIDRWTALRDEASDATTLAGEGEASAGAPGEAVPSAESLGEGLDAAHTADPGAPTLDELWKRAQAVKLTATKAKPFAKTLGITVDSASELTVEQMQKVLTAWVGRER